MEKGEEIARSPLVEIEIADDGVFGCIDSRRKEAADITGYKPASLIIDFSENVTHRLAVKNKTVMRLESG